MLNRKFHLHCLLIVFSIFSVLPLSAQDILSRFIIQGKGKEVRLNWVIQAGSTCNGIEIERSSDGQNFGLIHHIEGICGAIDKETYYNYTDQSPIPNQVSFYRLKLGSLAYSEVVSIEFIRLNDAGYLIKPNPVVDNSRIYFDNSGGKRHQLAVFNMEGSIVLEKFASNDFFEITNTELGSGLFIFTLQNTGGERVGSGKVIVVQ